MSESTSYYRTETLLQFRDGNGNLPLPLLLIVYQSVTHQQGAKKHIHVHTHALACHDRSVYQKRQKKNTYTLAYA